MPMPVINQNNELVTIEVSEIFSIYKDMKSRKIVITAECGEYYIPSTINQIILIMESSGFAQIDKNRIINLNQVKRFENGEVTIDGSEYWVAKRRRAKLKRLIEKRSRDTNGQ